MIIDPPSPFESTKEWEEFLASMKAIKPVRPFDIDAVRSAIEEAERELARRRDDV